MKILSTILVSFFMGLSSISQIPYGSYFQSLDSTQWNPSVDILFENLEEIDEFHLTLICFGTECQACWKIVKNGILISKLDSLSYSKSGHYFFPIEQMKYERNLIIYYYEEPLRFNYTPSSNGKLIFFERIK